LTDTGFSILVKGGIVLRTSHFGRGDGTAAPAGDPSDRFFRGRGVDVADHHHGALLAEADRRGGPDPARASGYDSDLPGQSPHGSPSSCQP